MNFKIIEFLRFAKFFSISVLASFPLFFMSSVSVHAAQDSLNQLQVQNSAQGGVSLEPNNQQNSAEGKKKPLITDPLILVRSRLLAENVKNFDVNRFKFEIRKSLEKLFGVEGSFDNIVKEFREEADRLYNKLKEFIKSSDDANVDFKGFEKYILDYFNETTSGSFNFVSEDEYRKLCSSNDSSLLQVYRTFYNKDMVDRFLGGQIFDIYGNNACRAFNLCVYDNYNYYIYHSASSAGEVGANENIRFEVGPSFIWRFNAVVDLSKMKIITSDNLKKIVMVLLYDHIEEIGFENLKWILCEDFKNGFSGYLYNPNLLSGKMFDQFFGEAWKKTFGMTLDEAFYRFNPNFYKLSFEEKETAVKDFYTFVSEKIEGYRFFEKNLEDIRKENVGSRKVSRRYCDGLVANKLALAIADLDLCAKLLGYQARSHYDDNGNKIISLDIIDPTCVTGFYEEKNSFDEKYTIKELYDRCRGVC